MDWELLAEYAPRFVDAAGMTLYISSLGILFSLILGLVCSVITVFKVPVASQIVAGYVELSRGTPLLIQLFLVYFGLPKLGILWDAPTCAVVALTFLGTSYMAEAFRGGLESIAPIQHESAYVLGLSRVQTMMHVVVPQALSCSIPGLVANVIFLIKESSVVSGIALADLMYQAKDIIGNASDTFEALFLLVVAYAVILLPISIVGTLLERRFDYGKR